MNFLPHKIPLVELRSDTKKDLSRGFSLLAEMPELFWPPLERELRSWVDPRARYRNSAQIASELSMEARDVEIMFGALNCLVMHILSPMDPSSKEDFIEEAVSVGVIKEEDTGKVGEFIDQCAKEDLRVSVACSLVSVRVIPSFSNLDYVVDFRPLYQYKTGVPVILARLLTSSRDSDAWTFQMSIKDMDWLRLELSAVIEYLESEVRAAASSRKSEE